MTGAEKSRRRDRTQGSPTSLSSKLCSGSVSSRTCWHNNKTARACRHDPLPEQACTRPWERTPHSTHPSADTCPNSGHIQRQRRSTPLTTGMWAKCTAECATYRYAPSRRQAKVPFRAQSAFTRTYTSTAPTLKSQHAIRPSPWHISPAFYVCCFYLNCCFSSFPF